MSTPGYRITHYRTMADVPEVFDCLFESAARQSVFLSRLWFELLEQSIFSGAVLIFTIESVDGLPLLVLPCYENCEKGKHLLGLSNYYSSLYAPLVSSECTEPAELFSALFKEINRFNYQSITFESLDRQSAEYSLLLNSLKCSGHFTDPYFFFGNWYESIHSPVFADYYQQRPSKLRNTIRRKAKKLGNYEIKIISDYSDVKKLLPQYQAIYASSWKMAESYPLFVENMVLALAKKNQLRLGLAYIDNEPAAAQIWFVTDGVSGKVASIYKLAYDPRFKTTSIGSILTSALFEHVIEKDQVIEIDYLTGDDAYKQDWMSHRRERWNIVAYNKQTLPGFLYGLKAVLAPWVKKYILRS